LSEADLMTMRATIKRSSGDADGYGAKAAPQDWQVVDDAAPCFVTSTIKRNDDDGMRVVSDEQLRGIFRADSGLRKGDRIEEVRDRRDRVILAGPMTVDAVAQRNGLDGPSHIEADLRRLQ
jgi:hypothetical protein